EIEVRRVQLVERAGDDVLGPAVLSIGIRRSFVGQENRSVGRRGVDVIACQREAVGDAGVVSLCEGRAVQARAGSLGTRPGNSKGLCLPSVRYLGEVVRYLSLETT